jgi:hypothetical protein
MQNRMLPLFVAFGLTSSAVALAFVPDAERHDGIEPQRIWRQDSAAQHRLAQQPAWRVFVAGEGRGWQATFDQLTGTPHRMSGPGLALGDATSESAVDVSLRQFLTRHPRLLGVPSSALQLRSARYVPSTDRWYVDYDLILDGSRIWRGGVTARLHQGRLVQLGIDTYPGIAIANRATIRPEQARIAAVLEGPARGADHNILSVESVLLPEEVRGNVHLRRTFLVRTETEMPRGRWHIFVDAESGTPFTWFNEVRHIAGAVYGERDVRTVNGDMTVEAVPLAPVTSPDGTVHTDSEGLFSTTGESTDLTTTFAGKYAKVMNVAGAEASIDFSGGDWTWTEESATQAEIDTYLFLHHVKRWGERVAPDVPMVVDRLNAYVNEEDTCNAYYDGDVHFFRAGNGCNNTGRIADVVYHEWGHGFHFTSMEAGDFDGSLSEGASDVVSVLQTGDPDVAPLFFTNGDPIRQLDIPKVYPRDFQNSELAVHSNGLIFGGAMWDLWQTLNAEHGVDAGKTKVESIFTGLLKGGPSIPTSYDEAVFADDDDANLGNGTPHLCAIIDAFAAHGLGPAANGDSLVSLMHTAKERVDADTPEPIRVDLRNVAPACEAFAPANALVHWRFDGGDWQTSALTLDANGAAGNLPAAPAGTFVEYYTTITDTGGTTLAAPRNGANAPYSYYAGDVIEVLCDDFESGDGGFKHELVAGTGALGADDWQWGFPMGEAGDPTEAHSGDYVWGNDLGDGDYNGAYLEGKSNRLRTPTIDTLHYLDLFLTYHRWLSVEDGVSDQATVSADDVELWTNHASEGGVAHTQDRGWAAQALDLAGAGDDGEVVIAWTLATDESMNFGGWTIDDVCVYAPATPDNRLGISDFTASDDREDGVELRWTQPLHGPVERVVVVRKADGMPTGPDDGEVVYTDDSPEIGAEVSVLDEEPNRKTTYTYAVYAFDGEQWLSWTREGFNADVGGRAKRDCGCVTSGPGAGWPLLLGALALVRRSRYARRSAVSLEERS